MRSRQAFILKSGAERDRYVTDPIVRLLSYHFGLGRLPWFEEGLARYLEGLRLEKDGTLTYGDADPLLLHNVTHGGLMGFEDLWEPRTAVTVRPRTPCRPEAESGIVWAWRSDGTGARSGPS
jgi:hypothetical protein